MLFFMAAPDLKGSELKSVSKSGRILCHMELYFKIILFSDNLCAYFRKPKCINNMNIIVILILKDNQLTLKHYLSLFFYPYGLCTFFTQRSYIDGDS